MIDGDAERGAPVRDAAVPHGPWETAVAAAAIRPGETVLELSSGAGFDSFLAARQAGPRGRVIGIEPMLIAVVRARANARAVAASNVEFRVGALEHLPVPDASVDVILSTSVSTVSPEKSAVISEALRVLRPGGRFAIRGVLDAQPVTTPAPTEQAALAAYCRRVMRIEEMRALLRAAGFDLVTIHSMPPSAEVVIHAIKPGAGARSCGPEDCS